MSIFYVTPVSTGDYRKRAKRKLPRFLFDYIDGAANAEVTLGKNTSDFNHWQLRQRVMRNVDSISTQTRLMGQDCSMPLALAPIGMAGMMARRGETSAASAAKNKQVPFAASTLSICPIEEIQQSVNAPFWFQLYMLRDRDLVLKLMQRAKQAQCNTLVFTVDLPVTGARLRDFKNGMIGGGAAGKLSQAAQIACSPQWLIDVALQGKPLTFGNFSEVMEDIAKLTSYKAFIDAQFDPSVTWKDIAWIREQWHGKLVIKGVMEVDDAKAAIDAGADGIVVSNHGGRQLDGIASSISKLKPISDAVGDTTEVLVDSGIRNGIDVLKALALGADGALIGRAWIYAVAAGGQPALENLLDSLQNEIATGMALMGVNSIEEINADLIESISL
ncbi:MAG: L-lactate dehydrogenase [Pseudomonadales bacterium]